MSRTARKPAELHVEPGPLPEAHALTLHEHAAVMQHDQAIMENALTVAAQVGYEGTMTVGALEDEIRFYQRRTVEAILETGKRLLVMKELTLHGEFEKRVELLGFSGRTARRFMQAANKTAKSAILADLSKQAKNGAAFLELITHDDDDLQALADMDDIDRMGPSELRAAFRKARAETKGDMAAKDKLIQNQTEQIQKLHKQVARIETSTPEEAVLEIRKQADVIAFSAEHEVGVNLRKAFEALIQHGDVHHHSEYMLGLITQIELVCDVLRGDFGLLKERPDGDSTPLWARGAAGGVN